MDTTEQQETIRRYLDLGIKNGWDKWGYTRYEFTEEDNEVMFRDELGFGDRFHFTDILFDQALAKAVFGDLWHIFICQLAKATDRHSYLREELDKLEDNTSDNNQ